ncbi:MAG: 50S ribosomal protein L23 [Patescibacteria group bacterium]
MTALKIFGKKKKEIKRKEESKVAPVEGMQQAKVALSIGQHLTRPHITEKATELASAKNQYVFQVQTRTTKKEVKKDVEKMYGVTVERVRIINVHPKEVRLGRTKGVKKGYKKAIVKVREGQKIEILPT